MRTILLSLFLVVIGQSNAAHAQSDVPELMPQITVKPAVEVKAWGFDPATQKYAHTPSVEEIRKEALAGNAVAQFMMSNMYAYGLHGQTVNASEVIRFLTLSANQGYLPAIKNLAQSYMMGSLVAKNLDKAIQLFYVAAEAGDVWSMSQLGSLYQLSGFGQSPGERQKNWDQAIYWYTRAADKGDVIGLYNLANAYKAAEPAKSVDLFKRLVASDDAGMMYASAVEGLADLYYSYADQGIAQNLPEARRLSEIAANLDDPAAQHRLGVMYYEGEGVERDDLKAYSWLKLSAANNDPEGVEDYQTVSDQITPALMKQVDENISRLRERIAANVAERKARYEKIMGAKGVTVIFPGQ
ncbi:MAG: tetratricopeptide repeat protein [Asticcacaulis sp.]|uniref:tetratricopeptide repeat protein n=1 Tax=Asticcacaulis sp. TaxID=1872648 RepID=UPI0039E297C6